MTRDFHICSAALRHLSLYWEIFISVKRCSVIFSNNQSFSVLIITVSSLRIAEFLLCNNTDHGCFRSETVIFIEIHAMCINYQFWIILKNLFTSLSQSGVSMIIAESSKDVNLGCHGENGFPDGEIKWSLRLQTHLVPSQSSVILRNMKRSTREKQSLLRTSGLIWSTRTKCRSRKPPQRKGSKEITVFWLPLQRFQWKLCFKLHRMMILTRNPG